MSAEHDRVRAIAERIAQRVSLESGGQDESGAQRGASAETDGDLAAVRRSIAELKSKLYALEENLPYTRDENAFESGGARDESGASRPERGVSTRPPAAAHSPWLSGIYVPAAHPSVERFGVEEAAVSELVDFFEKEKVCELEPGGKPCTHCDMCSTRGF
jgi:hypothetical protein